MFLEPLRRRNPAFLAAVVELHQRGDLPPGCYVLDCDAIEANARAIRSEAARLGLDVLAMTKQVSRHPAMIAACIRAGITRGVAVDMPCAHALRRAGMGLGHVGHLNQVPVAQADAAVALAPESWTVYSVDKAREAAAASARAGRVQDLYLRVVAEGDVYYRNQEGGVPAGDILALADELDSLDGARFAGITTFPGLLFDEPSRTVKPLPNLATLELVAATLAAAGRRFRVNAPGTTSTAVLSMLAGAGVTQVEPGHGLTGTTPLHAFHEDLQEVPAVLYLSEVSHRWAGESYVFGGGLYVDPVFAPYELRAFVGRSPDALRSVPIEIPDPSMIDYHGMLQEPDAATGDTVVMGFRPQAFFVRCPVAAVTGIRAGAPRVAGICGPDGRLIEDS